MRARLLTLLIGLYPRAWRRRYGDELRTLVRQLARTGQRSRLTLAFGLIGGAAREWRRARGRQIRGALAAGTVTAVVVVLLAGAGGEHTPVAQRTASSGLRPRVVAPEGFVLRAGRVRHPRDCAQNYYLEPADGTGRCVTVVCHEGVSAGRAVPSTAAPATAAAGPRCAQRYATQSGRQVPIITSG